MGSGFQFEKYTSGGEQYTIGALAKEGDEVWQVTQTLVQTQRTLSIQKKKLSNTTAYGNIFEMSERLSEEKSMPITTKCDSNPNSNADTNTTTIPEPNGGGRYDVKVYLEDGKWQVQVTLKGKPHEKTSTQKAAIEAEMNKEIAEKLNELEGLNGKRSRAVTAQSTEDSGEFWVKDMNGLEWLHTICDLGSSVWENAALPETYWNKDKGYNDATIHMPPLLTGVGDGVIDQVTEFPQLIKLGYDVATKSEVRQGIWNAVKNITPSGVYALAEKSIKEKIERYNFDDKSYLGYHELGKDGVKVVNLATSVPIFIRKGKDALESNVKETGGKYFKIIDAELDRIWQLSKQKLGRFHNSRILGENLEAVGKVRPPNSAAHHIAAGGSNNIDAIATRRLLKNAEIDINEATNGVFLPKNSKYLLDNATAHTKVHTNLYYKSVYGRLNGVPIVPSLFFPYKSVRIFERV